MKMMLILLSLIILPSCSTVKEKASLSERIKSEEVRSFQEIRSHAEYLLTSHTELNEKTKIDLRILLDKAMARQLELKDEESKIFQLLLSKSFRINQLTTSELKDKNSLKLRLNEVYEEKSKNVLGLINNIVVLADQNAINDSFRYDMMEFMRDFR